MSTAPVTKAAARQANASVAENSGTAADEISDCYPLGLSTWLSDMLEGTGVCGGLPDMAPPPNVRESDWEGALFDQVQHRILVGLGHPGAGPYERQQAFFERLTVFDNARCRYLSRLSESEHVSLRGPELKLLAFEGIGDRDGHALAWACPPLLKTQIKQILWSGWPSRTIRYYTPGNLNVMTHKAPFRRDLYSLCKEWHPYFAEITNDQEKEEKMLDCVTSMPLYGTDEAFFTALLECVTHHHAGYVYYLTQEQLHKATEWQQSLDDLSAPNCWI